MEGMLYVAGGIIESPHSCVRENIILTFSSVCIDTSEQENVLFHKKDPV